MWSSIALLASATLIPSALGAPERPRNGMWARSINKPAKPPRSVQSQSLSCMSDDEAQQVATNFKDLIVEYSDSLANSSLTVNFVDYSDSVIELINSGCTGSVQELGTATFDSRAAFIEGQSAQPSIPWEQLNIW